MSTDDASKQSHDGVDVMKSIGGKAVDAGKRAAGKAGNGARRIAASALENAAEHIEPTSDELDTANAAEPGQEGGSAKKSRKAPLIGGIAAVLVLGVLAFTLLAPGGGAMITKDDVISSAMLEKAINIENLSSAEFVYKGVAEHYKGSQKILLWETGDKVDYRILYSATVKATMKMSEVKIEVDPDKMIVNMTLPPIELTPSVSADSIQFIPRDTDANPKDMFDLCLADVTEEAQQSEMLMDKAKENARDIIEALTLPILDNAGYKINWLEAEDSAAEDGESSSAAASEGAADSSDTSQDADKSGEEA